MSLDRSLKSANALIRHPVRDQRGPRQMAVNTVRDPPAVGYSGGLHGIDGDSCR